MQAQYTRGEHVNSVQLLHIATALRQCGLSDERPGRNLEAPSPGGAVCNLGLMLGEKLACRECRVIHEPLLGATAQALTLLRGTFQGLCSLRVVVVCVVVSPNRRPCAPALMLPFAWHADRSRSVSPEPERRRHDAGWITVLLEA